MMNRSLMGKAISKVLFILILIVAAGAVCSEESASADQSRRIDFWGKSLSLSAIPPRPENMDHGAIDADQEILLESKLPVYGLTLTGQADLNAENSLVRIILVDQSGNEYLAYESYPLITGERTFRFTEACEETCFLDEISPARIKIEIIEASVHIEKINLYAGSPVPRRDIQNIRKRIKSVQDLEKIDLINKGIKKRGLRWVAGETSVSRLTYAEKRALWGDRLPNLQGAEYYKGGILEVKSRDSDGGGEDSPPSSLIASFDWRKVHGADNPGSPYYDGDPLGSGWLTPVKSQGCNHCWAFAPLHATEALVNLYFNQHLDLDLSEQDVASCSGGEMGCCKGGYTYTAINYLINTGVVDEACFPYGFNCLSCGEKCQNHSSHIKIAGKFSPSYDDEPLKRAVLTHGPIVAGIFSWWHIMVLVGFEKDAEDGGTIWIFKNSWGTGWGDNGYGYLKVARSNLYNVYVLYGPIENLANQFETACLDEDGDGYYNWGISQEMPASCPAGIPPERDCDDSNPLYGPMDENGHCTVIGEGYPLTVETPGLEYGTITSLPPGIHCGRHCSRLLATATSVTLAATANPGYAFSHWTGDSTGTDNPLAVTMDREKTVRAEFIPVPETVSTPDLPTGPDSGSTGDSYSFTTGGSISSLGHDVQYLFDWGEGTDSEWLPVGITSASKSWSSPGTYRVMARARCIIDTQIVSDWSPILSVTISDPETVSIPTTLNGPISGITSTTYAYFTGGFISNLGHPVEYQFDWGDGSLSDWSVSTTLKKAWSSPGIYTVRSRARCESHPQVISEWSPGLIVNITNLISLRFPSEGASFGACSLYALPAFAWDVGQPFRIYEIQFSRSVDFSSVPVSMRVFGEAREVLMRLFTWRNVLSIPGPSGGMVYWRVAGARTDRTTATSKIRSMVVEPAQKVADPTLSSTSKSTVPALSWENHCNVRFKAWFGSDINFTKNTSYTFNLRNPMENEGIFTRQLALAQWNAIRRLVGDVSGAVIFWYVESWDGLGRYSRTEVVDFVLMD